MAYCTNHTWVETQRGCPDCGRPYCDQCLVEFLGNWYCGPCRDRRLYQMQGGQAGGDAPLAGTGTVDIGGWLSGGWQIIQSDLGTFILAGLVGGLITVFSCLICGPAMMAGVTMMAFRRMTYGSVEFNNLFDGFRRFGWALLTAIIIGIISLAISYGFMIPALVVQSAAGRGSGAAVATSVVCQILSWVVSALVGGATFFALPHVAARNANPGDALAVSFQVFRRNPLMFTLASFLFNLVGFGFCVGIIVTYPLMLAAHAKAYSDHFGIQGWDTV